jgi:hypothetical protein
MYYRTGLSCKGLKMVTNLQNGFLNRQWTEQFQRRLSVNSYIVGERFHADPPLVLAALKKREKFCVVFAIAGPGEKPPLF